MKSQNGRVRLALSEQLTPPCYDFICGELEDHPHTIKVMRTMTWRNRLQWGDLPFQNGGAGDVGKLVR